MKTPAIVDGDLVLTSNAYLMIEGPRKVRQDLGIAMREPYGCDRFHPRWGSLLPNYIGDPPDEETRALVRSEVTRLIQNYIAVQQDQLQREAAEGRATRFSSNEVVARIDDVLVRQEYDRFHVKVVLRTLSRQQVTLISTVATDA